MEETSTTGQPLLSVLIPTYNRADFLRKCLGSVLAFSGTGIEVIVSDNASPDGTEAVAASFSDTRLRYFRQTENIGAVRNFRFLAGQAQGTYLFFLTDDDFLLTGALETVLGFIRTFSPDGFKCSLLVHQIRSHAAYLYGPFSETFVASPGDYERQADIFWNAHIATCTCIRRDKLDFTLYDNHISNLYPSMLFMAMAQNRLGFLHEPIAVHIWENEVFWDEGVRPEQSSLLLTHRADILNIMEDRLPTGFLKACESRINRHSLNVPSIARFLNPAEQKERRVAFKTHAIQTRYERFLQRWIRPADRWIMNSLAPLLARWLAR